MVETRVKVNGMACGMCEAHVNDAVRRAFSVNKVTSSRSKHSTVILSEQPLDESTLRRVIEEAGYSVEGVETQQYQKKRFSLLGK